MISVKKTVKSITAVILAISLIIGFASIVGAVESAPSEGPSVYTVGDIVEFGSYPQAQVTDEALLAELNSQTLEWISYGYYTGEGKVGTMVASDYTQYADIVYNGEKYRAVTFTKYRPVTTISSAEGSNQKNNGYLINTVYWFKYEPLKWRILDVEEGLVISENIIDSQSYHNVEYYYTDDPSGERYYGDPEFTFFANNYEKSTVRAWLNDDFYNTAFTAEEKAELKAREIDNSCYDADSPQYDSNSTVDKVFLLSYAEAKNTEYGFSGSGGYDLTLRAQGSDYAKSQGLYVYSGNDYKGNSGWYLRSAHDWYSYYVCSTTYSGSLSQESSASTSTGIRPVIQIEIDNSGAEETLYRSGDIIEFGSYPVTNVTDAALIAELDKFSAENDSFVTYAGKKYYVYDTDYYAAKSVYYEVEPIQWRVLSVKNGELYVLSKEVLDCQTYNEENVSVTWESSSLRAWLNNVFYNRAFGEAEKAVINTTLLTNEDNLLYGIDGGSDTEDKVFLPSYSDACSVAYGFVKNSDRDSQVTQFASHMQARKVYWWLRTPGKVDSNACYVYNGTVKPDGYYVSYDTIGVRPAMKLDLSELKYSIEYKDADGNVLTTQTYAYGDEIALPDDPVKDGYTFAGWDGELPETMPAKNLSVTAKMTSKIISVATDKTNAKLGETTLVTVVADSSVSRLRLKLDGADGAGTVLSYTPAASAVNVTENSDGTKTWEISVRFAFSGSDIEQQQKWNVSYRASGTGWIETDKSVDIKVTKASQAAGANAIISVSAPETAARAAVTEIVVVTTADVNKVRLNNMNGRTVTYLKSSSNVSVAENGDSTTWTISYRFSALGEQTWGVQCRGSAWSEITEASSFTITVDR